MSNMNTEESLEVLAAEKPARVWSAQQEAFFAAVEEGSRDIFLDAKAGTGKTTSIEEAMKRVPRGQTVLAIAFARSTADELMKRVPAGVEAKSFNQFGFGQLFRALGKMNVDGNNMRFIADKVMKKADVKAQWVHLRKLCGYAKGELAYKREAIDALVDKYQMDLGDPEQKKLRAEVVANAHRLLQAAANPGTTIDFDDQVWLHDVLDTAPKQFDWIFVDEAQDMNPMQWALLCRAVKKNGRIVAVGDPRQAIYGFRGAGGAAMVRRFCSERNALHMPLSVTFRCPKAVVAAVKGIVPEYEAHADAPEGDLSHEKWDDVAKSVEPGAFVISRTNAPLVKHCLAFVRAGKRACMLGRDEAARFASVIDTSKAEDVTEFLAWLSASEKSEMARMRPGYDDDKADRLADRNESLREISSGLEELADLKARIESFFADKPDGKAVVFSTTHKIKGAENKNVYVLEDTYRLGQNEEEDNMWYVALTRSQHKLVICEGGVK